MFPRTPIRTSFFIYISRVIFLAHFSKNAQKGNIQLQDTIRTTQVAKKAAVYSAEYIRVHLTSTIGDWGENYPKCKNTANARQSPINIKSRDTVYKDMSLKTNNYDDTHDVYFNMANKDSSITFEAKNEKGKIPQTVEFKGTRF